MGLDMNPMAKPLAGHEDEFRDVLFRLDAKAPDGSSKGFLGRLFGKSEDRDALLARFNEISVPPYAAIGAPIVGQDEAADTWVRETYAAGRMPGVESEAEALEKMAGYHALQAMPECDGFPVYTHAYDYEGVDRTSFRGSFLPLCQSFLGEALLNAAWNNMLADDLAAWGRDVGDAARRFAEQSNVTHVLGKRRPDEEFDEEDPATLAHIADSAARWAVFWSERGHGSEAYF